MEQSANLQLPYIMPSQAQKHVTHNESIRTLDALVQLAVLDRDLSTPPISAVDGARYLVATGGTDAWAGKDGKVAAWQDGAWAFLAPKAGWLLWIADEDRLLGFDGAAWIDAAVHSVNPAPLVGVNATADAANRLAVKSPASLFDEEAGDHRLKINKAAAGDTASLVFQSGYSGRAEFGLAGDDDWHVKVSADGAAWTEALTVDRTSGRVRLPAALPLGDENQIVTRRHVRDLLPADRTYYVRPDGDDGNDGLTDDAGGAFLTPQKAWDTIVALDLGGHVATIQLADGTYTAGINSAASPTGGSIVINGNVATPANVVVATAGASCVYLQAPCVVTLQNFEVRTATSQSCVRARGGAKITIGAGMRFGPCAEAHMRTDPFGFIQSASNYSVVGAAGYHWFNNGGGMSISANTVTITGTPAFAVAWALAQGPGYLTVFGVIFSGSATGTRYSASLNGVINTFGAGATALPGNGAGSTATGGQYS
jgi:hypothetical protein